MKGWQKILTICAICVTVALSLGGAGALFVVNFNEDTAQAVEIINDGQDYYLTTPAVTGYNGYRFKFEGPEKFTVESKTNLVRLTDIQEVKLGEKYTISVCYLGQTEGSNSRYGKKYVWERAMAFLDKPQLKVSTDGRRLEWQADPLVDHYVVHYGHSSVQTKQNSINLTQFQGGIYTLTVTAHPKSTSYNQSTSAPLENQAIRHQLVPFKSAKIQQRDGKVLLVIEGKESVSKIDVVIGSQTKQFVTSGVLQSGLYVYTLDITSIYDERLQISVSPATQDQYNLAGNPITASKA